MFVERWSHFHSLCFIDCSLSIAFRLIVDKHFVTIRLFSSCELAFIFLRRSVVHVACSQHQILRFDSIQSF